MAWSKADAWMVDYLMRVHHFDPRREDMRIEHDDNSQEEDVIEDAKEFFRDKGMQGR